MNLCPFPHILVVLAPVDSIKVREWSGTLWVEPDLAKNARVNIAHQHLSDSVKAMRYMVAQNMFLVLEGLGSEAFVPVDIEVQRLPNEIQAVQMVHPLNVHHKTTTIFV